MSGNDSTGELPAVRLCRMAMTIWVDNCQMQYCGEPFRLGSQVAWTLRAADPDWLAARSGADAQQTVDAGEEHHGSAHRHERVSQGLMACYRRVLPRVSDDPLGHLVPTAGLRERCGAVNGALAEA
jgi:hypothetical protein